MIEVIKTNDLGIPVGTQFGLDEDGQYSSYEIHEDIGDDYEFTRSSLFGFSPSFYELNKEIFTDIKIEETNEKNKINEGPESPSTKSESEDLCDQDQSCDRHTVVATGNMRQELQRKEMEEATQDGESRGDCNDQESACYPVDWEEGREKDKRIARFATIDNMLFDLIGQVYTLQEGIIWTLRDEIQQLRKELR